MFKAGDVAGVYLHMETGEGFCTLNGRRLGMRKLNNRSCAPTVVSPNSLIKRITGDAGKKIIDGKFHIGKIYPCVGFFLDGTDVGLHLEVNFAGSEEHPFMYKGPFT
jgi:hypothetical protein